MNTKASSKKFARSPESPNLMQRAYQELRDSIVSGEIQSGDLLREQQIAQELQISRTPVREALAVLESEGLVEVRRGIGAFVKPLSYKDISHIFEVRRALEILAIRTALYHITQEDIQQLENRFHQLLTRYENHEEIQAAEFTRIDFELHDLIVDRCENPYVQRFMSSIHANIKRLQVMSFTLLSSLKESTEQHLHLLHLIQERDLPALEKALDEHISWSLECFMRE